MSKRIGETLIERGFLSRLQLEHALRLQLIFGGHLGTCLVELGFVEEASLAQTLASILGMKCARVQQLDDIPSEIVRMISREEVRKRRVVPFGVRRNSLHVAVTKPSSVSRLSTLTGCRIVPYLAPEIYILRAMERYYGIPRRRRYLKVAYSSLPSEAGQSSQVPTCAAPREAVPETRSAEPPPEANPPSAIATPRLGEHSRRMSRVNNHAELGEVILDFAVERMERCILFHVEHDTAGIANWRGVDFTTSRIAQVALPLEAESIFALALALAPSAFALALAKLLAVREVTRAMILTSLARRSASSATVVVVIARCPELPIARSASVSAPAPSPEESVLAVASASTSLRARTTRFSPATKVAPSPISTVEL